MDFRIHSTQVSLTDDKKHVYITINIDEGLPYRISESQFSALKVLTKEQLQDLIAYGVGDYYSRSKVRRTQNAIKEALGDLGYAFANVQVLPRVDKKRQEVALQYVINPNRRTYVRRIEFTGNYKTNDEVLRREMRQMEAAPYNHSKLERSSQRLQRLGYITSVKRSERPVDGRPDQVDVVYEIVETPNRSITAGVGYGSESGVLFNVGYETANFLGTGNRFSFDFSNSDTSRNYSLEFTDPYFTVDGISRSFSLYYSERNESAADIGDWTSDNWGAFLRFGFPINEYESFRIGGGYRGIEIKTGTSVAPEIPEWLAENGSKFNEFVLDFNWTHDTRDKTIFANSGAITRFSAEVVTPGSDETYYKVGLRNRTYFKLHEKLLTSVRADVSYGDGYSKSDNLPFYRHYYAGGLRTVRGFKTNSLGPRWSNDDVKGGDLRVTGGAELIFPWHLGQEAETVRLGAFVDFGNVFAGTDDFDVADFRYSTGLYVLWRSPIGPLNLSYATPLNEKPGDELERFQFTIGVPL
ncbi:MAG: outer membrane protein assembly factor BamA [Gammaproteobacteria bacterium]|nr:MAG: outer membrane protein assembly factor BamA [Gammaproteobacteria bacterium]